MIGRLAIVVTLLAGGHAANAQTYFGAGGTSCADYARAVSTQADIRYAMQQWALGYVSALNMAWNTAKGTDPLVSLDALDILARLQRYCESNPRRTLSNAANEFYFTLPR